MSVLLNPVVKDDLFSDRYLDAFYKAHVASRSKGSYSLDEDIAAIEAEMKKVRKYRSKIRSYRLEKQLNSCGSSECSDEDDLDTPLNSSPTSVFKVSNIGLSAGSAALSSYNGDYPLLALSRGLDIFTWAVAQQVSHDHNYCQANSAPGDVAFETPIDHGTINVKNIQWHSLSPCKRAQAVHKLACILQQRPSGRHSPTFSSLDLLPSSLANCIRKTGSIGLTGTSYRNKKRSQSSTSAGAPTLNNLISGDRLKAQKIGIKEIKSQERTKASKDGSVNEGCPSTPVSGSVNEGCPSTPISGSVNVGCPSTPVSGSVNEGCPSTPISGGNNEGCPSSGSEGCPSTPTNGSVGTIGPTTRSSARKRLRASPYSKQNRSTRQRQLEVTRVRNISCSEEGEDPIVID